MRERVVFGFVILIVKCLVLCGSPVGGMMLKKTTTSHYKALDFMKKYGYVDPDTESSAALYSEAGFSEIIKKVQHFGALPETGVLDEATLKLMNSRRCGMPDVLRKSAIRSKRFALASKGWNRRNLTYFVSNWPHSLGQKTVERQMRKAFNTWAAYGGLRFKKRNDPSADIVIGFTTGSHGDVFPFDGPGGVLAHAFFPHEADPMGGDIHFDGDENWTKTPKDEGTYFYSVALHELGHSLGLAHSPVESAVMFPYYQAYDENVNLDYDDILGIYNLYIRTRTDDNYTPENEHHEHEDDDVTEYEPFVPTESSTTTTQTDTRTINYHGDSESVEEHKEHETPTATKNPHDVHGVPDICEGNFDAVATLRGELFIFKGKYMWRLMDQNEIVRGYPALISQMFPQLPGDVTIDAAYERPDSMIVLFTGNKFWVHNGANLVGPNPQPLSVYGLPDTIDKIDAVQIWQQNSKTYIYKDDYFWRYNETARKVDPGYPMSMSRWRGVPSNLDAATTWTDGVTYFFKGKEHWKFDNNWLMVTDTSPLPTPQLWLGCPEVD